MSSMSNDNLKARVATVDFGFVKVEGLMLPDGSYAIAAVQTNDVLKFSTCLYFNYCSV